MEKEILKIFKKVFELAIYDEISQKYYLNKRDYEILNLSDRKTRKLISEKCEQIGITLEYSNKPLPDIKDEELFEEYNYLQSLSKHNLPEEEKQNLEQRRIILRNKITEDNLELVKVIINRRLNEIHNNPDKDDIYQIGYEMLLTYINKNHLDKEKLKYDINYELILHIENEILQNKKNISYDQEEQLSKLKQIKEKEPLLTPKEISEKLKNKQKQTEFLLNLENIILSVSIDEEIERINSEDSFDEELFGQTNMQQSLLYNDTFEESLIDKPVIKEYINLIIETLPKEKQNILNLYYGLNGNSSYNMQQIAKIYGITKSRVSSSIKESLYMIRNSYRIKLLEEIYELPSEYGLIQSNSLNIDIEEFLIRNLTTEILTKISQELKEKERKFLLLYCQPNNYSTSEIAKILNISHSYEYQIKKRVIESIRNKIILSMHINKDITGNNQIPEDEYYQYLKYLINIYIHNTKIKRKH